MPWKSKKQRAWGHTAVGKEALGGKSAVHEWDEATKDKKLPEKVSKAEHPKISSPTKISTSIPNPMKVGSTSVKTPKPKMMADPFDKPSKFFKSENLSNVKHPSLKKLKAFLENKANKNSKLRR